MRQKCAFGMEPKITTVLPTCFLSLLGIRFVAVAFKSEEDFIKKGTPARGFRAKGAMYDFDQI